MVMPVSAEDNSAKPADLKPSADNPVLAYLELRRRVRIVAGTLMVLGFATAAGWPSPDSGANHSKNLEPAKVDGARVTASDEALRTFQRFAVNALVHPLIDDDVQPPQWTRHAIDWICDGRGEVAINGKPLVHGDRVPLENFTVRWNLQRCAPLSGSELLIEGDIELIVSYRGSALRTQIAAPELWVETATGKLQLPAITTHNSSAEEDAEVAQ